MPLFGCCMGADAAVVDTASSKNAQAESKNRDIHGEIASGTASEASDEEVLNTLPSCYLVYETENHGQLVEHYSKTHVKNAIGMLTAETIPQFKYQSPGRNVLIGNCSGGKQGRKQYCNGWVQFIKTVRKFDGNVKFNTIPTDMKALAVDIYFYYPESSKSVKLVPGKFYSTDNVLAVACIPRNSQFYENIKIDLGRFMRDGDDYGYAVKL